MALDTFAELKSTIADYLNRDDLTSIIPSFISLAEAKFNRKVRTRQMVVRAEGQIDTQFFAYPTDWLQAKEFQLNTNPIIRLKFVTEAQGDELKASSYMAPGQPLYYTIVGSQIEFIPSPDTTYSAELTYYAKIPALSNANTSNWLLAYAPDLYLYGSLLEASPYLKDDERLAVWSQLYTNTLGDIEVADQRASVSSTPVVRAKTLG
jgi:hypothetical protein